MPNQPAKDTKGIYIRVHESVKAAIQADIDKRKKEAPDIELNISSWIREAIKQRLDSINKKEKRKNN